MKQSGAFFILGVARPRYRIGEGGGTWSPQTASFTAAFFAKTIELSFLFSYSLGGKVLDQDYISMMTGGASPGRSFSKELLDSWTTQHTKTNVPRMTTDDLGWANTSNSSTRFLYSAS